ncbi:MAG TPA: addiction module toxin, HicA family [Syntrophothermus lipocalidus]|nr:type II toxin-antitoxin system HicA family toxin [Syntrophothermus sp.]HHV75855.1 addiction module toxin, HicA family [Syntrophothermus lipocalidus]
MSKLPRVTGKEMLQALQRSGFVITRVQSSRHFLCHPKDRTRWATVPVHGKETLSPKVIKSIYEECPFITRRT